MMRRSHLGSGRTEEAATSCSSSRARSSCGLGGGAARPWKQRKSIENPWEIVVKSGLIVVKSGLIVVKSGLIVVE